MRIFVTGIAGFIGSHIADYLLADGHAVYGIDNLTTGRVGNVPTMASFEKADILDAGVMDGFDLIVHCAASYKDPDNWFRDVATNVLGAQIVAESRTPTVYFQTVLPPTSSYAISKIAAEHYLRLSGAPLTVYRLANIYGPRNLSGPIPAFYQRITDGEPCRVVNTSRDFVYVEDLADYVVRNLGRPGDYTIASGAELTIPQVYDMIAQLLGCQEPVEHAEPGPDDLPAMPLTPADDFPATTSFFTGLRAAVDWYIRNGVRESYTHLRAVGEVPA